MRDTSYFQEKEIECHCGCGFKEADPDFLNKLNTARHIAEIPFIVTSFCRCPKHNKAVGGSSTSSHLKGIAADILFKDFDSFFRILNSLRIAGFTRFGFNFDKMFIHVDSDTSKPNPALWRY